MNKSKSFNKRVKVSNKANKKREPQVFKNFTSKNYIGYLIKK